MRRALGDAGLNPAAEPQRKRGNGMIGTYPEVGLKLLRSTLASLNLGMLKQMHVAFALQLPKEALSLHFGVPSASPCVQRQLAPSGLGKPA